MGLHGGGGSSLSFSRKTAWSEKADEEGFVVVYPNGSGRWSDERLLTRNAAHGCGYAHRKGVDDVGFIRKLIGRLKVRLPVDGKRIYVTGHSNGAFMAHRLGSEASDLIAAIAPVAGAVGGRSSQGKTAYCVKPSEPVACVMLHGRLDGNVAIGGVSTKGIERKRWDCSLRHSIRFWLDAWGLVEEGVEETLLPGELTKLRWSGRDGAAKVLVYVFETAGHEWPGQEDIRIFKRWRRSPAPQQHRATDLIWDYFEEQRID
jgi:polyhydroxybutyrate depolymerase